ncbi:2-succinyl-6-hydroxy-2,4-cyclohexadiene-1-carboxylate synthase [Usitatibacter palustris]|uniref:2-succinyl-6-hydroxy-2, 4-cyclohexadiene-1-carboxylate synthase n=1 Tax=Usitatibacter palustris TaxID=2732487 RepID=A0A6M4H386_9PROT|nr:2-succinyl-6-hydroxy-2,4-cyclohexadiene-1-carboxylate synthase [Usitatibacter palustris]
MVCVDVAGRGTSDWLPAPLYGFPQFLSDLNALLAHLRVREVDWVGTSMGGLLGMLLAAQRNSPVRRLVMNDVGAFLPTPALQTIGRNLLGPTSFPTLAAIDAHLKRTHKEWGRIPPEQWRALVRHGSRKTGNEYRLHYDPAIARLVQPMPLSPGIFFWDAWQKVTCPTLLLRGETSHVFPRTVADTMLLRHDNARLEEIPGCGHAPSLMLPGHVDLVAEFLDAPAASATKRAAITRRKRVENG